MGRVYVGISGWSYAPWRGNFFPKGLPHRLELAYASRTFNAIEINGTFYSLQRPSSFQSWYGDTPPGFVFALKGPRFITHMKKLRDARAPLANFFANGPLALREKLGPILWQLPPQLPFEPERMREFLDLLPRDSEEALRLARGHDMRVKGRTYLDLDVSRPLRHAVEFRHPSFLSEELVDLLCDRNVALVAADTAGHFPVAHDVTADWVYVRLHGSRRLYVSGYRPREIEAWASRIEAWRDGRTPPDCRLICSSRCAPAADRDVFVFFDNTDVKLRAPVDARRLSKRLGVGAQATPRRILAEVLRSDETRPR